MKHELCCGWLGLAATSWPPDYYSLLGLRPGDGNVERIEQEVHSRLSKVRAYQLSYPELATETMNLLAHALLCLCDPAAKQVYDHKMGIPPPAPPSQGGERITGSQGGESVPSNGAALTGERVAAATQVDWKQAPLPPVRGAPNPAIPGPTVVAREQGQVAPAPPDPPAVAPPAPVARPAVSRDAENSPAARRGLGTPAAIYERISHTRQLLWAWEQAGKFLNKPARRVARPLEEKELAIRLEEVCDLIEDYPPFVGFPGQPGYRVIAMARLEMTSPMFKNLDRPQREVLARDWIAGYTVLRAHRQFLRRELRALRQQGWISRAIRATRSALNDHPGWVLFGITVAAVLVVMVHLMIFPKL